MYLSCNVGRADISWFSDVNYVGILGLIAFLVVALKVIFVHIYVNFMHL